MKIHELVQKYGLAVAATIPPEVLMGNGDVYFVDSGATLTLNANDGEHGNSWEQPFATVNYAISRCTANHNDVILLAPTHAETIQDVGTESGAVTDEFCVDKAGITILGLVMGNVRPVFTFEGATDARIALLEGSTNVTLKGIRLVSNLADIEVGIGVSITSDGAVLEDIEFRDSGAAKEFLIGIGVGVGCHNVTIKDCSFLTTAAAGNANAINAAAVTDLKIIDNVMYGAYSTGAVLTSGILTRCNIAGNTIINSAAIAIALNGTTSTGILAHNNLGGTTSIAAAVTGNDDLSCFENYVNGDALAGVSGLLDPAADGD